MEIQTDWLIKTLHSVHEQNKVIYLKNGSIHIAKGNICLYRQLGNFIDVIWDSSKANMLIKSSIHKNILYHQQQNFQIIQGVQLRDANTCPYYEKQFTKSEKFYKPCACVLLVRQEDSQILVTRRKLTLNSFPGAWVLPGGHLEKGEGLLQGGLRQAEQEVGLNIQSASILLDHGVMAWESAFCVDNKIVSSSFVILFSAKVPKYQVKPQQTQIQQFVWKDAKDISDQHKYTSVKRDGYGQAHLNYLSFYRLKNYQIEQKKPWIKQEIALRLQRGNQK